MGLHSNDGTEDALRGEKVLYLRGDEEQVLHGVVVEEMSVLAQHVRSQQTTERLFHVGWPLVEHVERVTKDVGEQVGERAALDAGRHGEDVIRVGAVGSCCACSSWYESWRTADGHRQSCLRPRHRLHVVSRLWARGGLWTRWTGLHGLGCLLLLEQGRSLATEGTTVLGRPLVAEAFG